MSVDGAFGLDPDRAGAFDPWFGALAGFYKSLRKEWPASRVRIVDVDPESEAAQVAHSLIAEIQAGSPGVEVALGNGRRRMVRLENQEGTAGQTLGFSSSDTFLITGGGSGVTAQSRGRSPQPTPRTS